MVAARLGGPLPGCTSGSSLRIALERLYASQPLRVAYQGGRGSYSQEAAAVSFSDVPVTAFPCELMEDAFAALETGAADRAVVPAENSIDGPVARNFDLLLRHPLVEIAAELVLPVNHCLLSLPGDPVLRRVASHPQALSHCHRRLAALGLPAEEMPSAAAAAAALAQGLLLPGTAVIASRAAAREFRLAVVEENLQTGGNHTRFLQLGLRGAAATAAGGKATVAFALHKGPSELHRAIGVFENRGMSVSRVDHRPDRTNPVQSGRFEYVFILDVEAAPGLTRLDSPSLKAALNQLGEICRFVRLMGVYGSAAA